MGKSNDRKGICDGKYCVGFFFDNGIRANEKIDNCYEFPRKFEHPAQATRAMLNNIGPFKPIVIFFFFLHNPFFFIHFFFRPNPGGILKRLQKCNRYATKKPKL
jgi:hypothetical protein